MTREELKAHCERQIEMCEMWASNKGEEPSGKIYEEHKLILELLEQESCDDAISRQAVLDEMYIRKAVGDAITAGFIKNLPPVTPQSKTGHWILKYSEDALGERYCYWACSECDRSVGFNLANIEDVLSEYPYCHCGAKMVDLPDTNIGKMSEIPTGSESEDKE